MTAGPDIAAGGRDLVGVVQRFGLFSAASVVDRYADIVDRAIARDLAPATARPRTDLPGQLGRAWLRLLDVATDQLRDAPRSAPPDALVLPPTRPGLTSEASLWIHNTTSSPAPAVELRGTALLSATGRSIPAESVSLVPDRLDLVPAGTSREVRLRVRVATGQDPGTYHGMVMTTAAPAEPMALILEVRGP
jgi:hypothetical protein